jgi:hypothetical protein
MRILVLIALVATIVITGPASAQKDKDVFKGKDVTIDKVETTKQETYPQRG